MIDKGGHLAAWEQPALFSAEIRAAFRSLRKVNSHAGMRGMPLVPSFPRVLGSGCCTGMNKRGTLRSARQVQFSAASPFGENELIDPPGPQQLIPGHCNR